MNTKCKDITPTRTTSTTKNPTSITATLTTTKQRNKTTQPLKYKLELILEKLQHGTIGENIMKNIHQTKEKYVLEIFNPDLILTSLVIKTTPYEQNKFDKFISELKQLGIIEET